LRRFPPEVAAALVERLEQDAAAVDPRGVTAAARCAGPRAAALVPFLARVAGDAEGFSGDDLIRAAALEALTRIDPDGTRSRAAFLAALSEPSDLLRLSGAYSFLSVGSITAEEREALGRMASTGGGLGATAAAVLTAHDNPLAYASARE